MLHETSIELDNFPVTRRHGLDVHRLAQRNPNGGCLNSDALSIYQTEPVEIETHTHTRQELGDKKKLGSPVTSGKGGIEPLGKQRV